MLTMTYGTVPTVEQLRAGDDGDGWFHRFAGEDARVAEDIGMPDRIPRTEAIDVDELYPYLVAMVRLWEDAGDEEAGDLASSILRCFDIEWV